MKAPNKKDFCEPFGFDGKLVLFDKKAYIKAVDEYVVYLQSEIRVAYDFLESSGVNLGDNGVQSLQILETLVKSFTP